MISEPTIDSAWKVVTERARKAAGDTSGQWSELSRSQPALSDFISEAVSHFAGPDGPDLLCFIGLVVWNACGGPALPEIGAERVVEHYRAAESWVGGIGSLAILAEKKIRDYNTYEEPYLMAFAFEAILDCVDDDLEISPEDQELALVASKAVIDALGSKMRQDAGKSEQEPE